MKVDCLSMGTRLHQHIYYSNYHAEHVSCPTQDFHQALVELKTSHSARLNDVDPVIQLEAVPATQPVYL